MLIDSRTRICVSSEKHVNTFELINPTRLARSWIIKGNTEREYVGCYLKNSRETRFTGNYKHWEESCRHLPHTLFTKTVLMKKRYFVLILLEMKL